MHNGDRLITCWISHEVVDQYCLFVCHVSKFPAERKFLPFAPLSGMPGISRKGSVRTETPSWHGVRHLLSFFRFVSPEIGSPHWMRNEGNSAAIDLRQLQHAMAPGADSTDYISRCASRREMFDRHPARMSSPLSPGGSINSSMRGRMMVLEGQKA